MLCLKVSVESSQWLDVWRYIILYIYTVISGRHSETQKWARLVHYFSYNVSAASTVSVTSSASTASALCLPKFFLLIIVCWRRQL